MSNLTQIAEGFARDENGKIWALPMKLPSRVSIQPSSSTKKTDEKRSVIRRKYIPIEPLRGNVFDSTEADNPSKRKKIERPVRKELFKMPVKKPEKRYSSFSSRRSISKARTPTTKTRKTTPTIKNKANVVKTPKIVINDGSPLLDVDNAENLLKQNSVLTNPVNKVLFPMTSIEEESNNTPTKLPIVRNKVTPTSSSDLEFLELEKQLASAKKSAKKMNTFSPMTTVCTLFEKTKIVENNNQKTNDLVNLVRQSLEQLLTMKREFEVIQQKFSLALDEQQNTLVKVLELLEQSGENKENVSKKSVKNFVISPAISKKVDLRKSTLNKNLSKNFNCESPRMRKAVDSYNSIRNDWTVLCTPKFDRTTMEVPQGSVTRSLARRIQKQCLLLQDTPKPSS